MNTMNILVLAAGIAMIGTISQIHAETIADEISANQKSILTLKEAAKCSNLSVGYLKSICESDEGKSFTLRDGNRLMIKRKSFDAWLEKVEQI